ncbi:MAG: carbon-nitrogen hydrolase [Planctomycetota bacterium]|nr:MAG: carbon-nitrogen hydrolase [Planctomycetota bacterium]
MDFLAALCQSNPTLGNLERNFESHHQWLDRALEAKADLVLFPELSLTGYMLKDLTQDVAMGLEDPRVQDLVARSSDCSLVFGMVEESRDHQFFNSMVFAEGGRILHVHRKVHLPDYGIFEEGRYFASGTSFEKISSRLGDLGLMICEDAWHPTSAWLHFLQGVQVLMVPSTSPARGVDTDAAELASQRMWRVLLSAHSIQHQCWSLYCNRVGFEDGAMYWGGSLVISPFGHPLAEAEGEVESLLLHRIESDPVRRARIFTPLLRDSHPDLVRRQLARILDDRDALQAQRNEENDREQIR